MDGRGYGVLCLVRDGAEVVDAQTTTDRSTIRALTYSHPLHSSPSAQ